MENNKKTFKEKYTSDPDYKAKHMKYISEKLECECGCMVMRVAMAKHKRTAKHDKLVKSKQKNHDVDIEELVERLVTQKLKDIQLNI